MATPTTELRHVSPADDPTGRQVRAPVLGARLFLVPPKITNQPAGDRLVLVRLSTFDGNGGRPLKPDLDSARRQLVSKDLLARVRVWGARLGLGSALLDALEQFALAFANKGGVGRTELLKFLKDLVAAGKLELSSLLSIPPGDLLAFPNLDLGRPMSASAVTLNENLLGNEMSVGGAVAKEMFAAWVTQSATPPALRRFPSLDQATATAANFRKAAEAFEDRLKENLGSQLDQGEIDYRDLVTGPGPERLRDDKGEIVPPVQPIEEGRSTRRRLPSVEPLLPDLGILTDTVVKICIGSFQGIEVTLSDFEFHLGGTPPTGLYSGRLRYELRDHFGVDDEDCEVRTRGIHGTPGQVAMWVLQHHAPNGHRPFIDQVVVERTFSGTIF
ncbi:hypothetical protein [Piscinibacter sakaiensis]|uniref:Uncharacterized protein n=1 Tax=Piscinibacter sakaiensis TaxID=1547922 RepID=A0A0K8NWJ6_PISS1|nr:hypothetical protein [Piscinibacter sakaiensis]GAP34315.1 hypothetical protein ISF6_4490 [Piscinibacter sakaiensis]